MSEARSRLLSPRECARARCAWVELDRDSRISEILIYLLAGRRPAGDGKAVFARLA